MASRIYRPRAFLRMFVPVERNGTTETVSFEVNVVRAQLESNDHTRADKLTTTLEWSSTGIDPRWLTGATCEFYLGNATEDGTFAATDADERALRKEFGLDADPNLRFVGQLAKPGRKLKGDTLTVELEWHDYTTFFLVAKPFATAGVPLYSETLAEAWSRICKHTPGAEALAEQIEFRGITTIPVIGSAVAQRFRKKGGLTVDAKSDAWAVWQQCVGVLGLISYIDLDMCIVTTATDYYTSESPPSFVYGRNILDFTEERNNNRIAKGVGISSFDPITGRALEALYPLPSDPRMTSRHPKKSGAKKRKGAAQVLDKKDYDFFPYPGVTDPEILQGIARRVYEERSRQEVEGTITTADMTADTPQRVEFDLLNLLSGDTIEVRFIDAENIDFMRQYVSAGDRVSFLVSRGYSESVAEIIAANVDRIGSKGNLFYCKTVTTTIESNDDGGTFKIDIQYCNKIDPTAGAVATA